MPIWRRLLPHCPRRADSRAACTAGRSRPTSPPMIAITTSSSTSVNPRRRMFWLLKTSILIPQNISFGCPKSQCGEVRGFKHASRIPSLARRACMGVGCHPSPQRKQGNSACRSLDGNHPFPIRYAWPPRISRSRVPGSRPRASGSTPSPNVATVSVRDDHSICSTAATWTMYDRPTRANEPAGRTLSQ